LIDAVEKQHPGEKMTLVVITNFLPLLINYWFEEWKKMNRYLFLYPNTDIFEYNEN